MPKGSNLPPPFIPTPQLSPWLPPYPNVELSFTFLFWFHPAELFSPEDTLWLLLAPHVSVTPLVNEFVAEDPMVAEFDNERDWFWEYPIF